jgi:hypothetical protein
MGKPPRKPEGVLVGYLTEVETSFDHLSHATQVRIHISLSEVELRDNGGLGWLQPGAPIEIRQFKS